MNSSASQKIRGGFFARRGQGIRSSRCGFLCCYSFQNSGTQVPEFCSLFIDDSSVVVVSLSFMMREQRRGGIHSARKSDPPFGASEFIPRRKSDPPFGWTALTMLHEFLLFAKNQGRIFCEGGSKDKKFTVWVLSCFYIQKAVAKATAFCSKCLFMWFFLLWLANIGEII